MGEGFEDVRSWNPLRVIPAYLAPREPCGDTEQFLDAIATALPPLPREQALAALPPPIGRLDFAPRRIEQPDAPFETLHLVVAEVVRKEVGSLGAAAFHAARDAYQPAILSSAFALVDERSPRRGIGVVGPPSHPEERLLVDTGPRIVDLRLRGFLPKDPRPLRVHSALRDESGIVVLASFVAAAGGVESRTLARLRFDPEGRLRQRTLAELPLLERPERAVDTFVREARPTSDGGLTLVLHHATGGSSSPQFRIRLVPAGHPLHPNEAGAGVGSAG